MNHLMLDLETLGTKPGCMILSIGAVGFDPYKIGIDERNETHKFYVNVALEAQKKLGLDFSPDTLTWWINQTDEAKEHLFNGEVTVHGAVDSFIAFWHRNDYKYVWSHGSTFDIPILHHIIEAVGCATPWKFWDVRDTWTAFALANFQLGKPTGVHHYAYDDAVRQAKGVQLAYRSLNLGEK